MKHFTFRITTKHGGTTETTVTNITPAMARLVVERRFPRAWDITWIGEQ